MTLYSEPTYHICTVTTHIPLINIESLQKYLFLNYRGLQPHILMRIRETLIYIKNNIDSPLINEPKSFTFEDAVKAFTLDKFPIVKDESAWVSVANYCEEFERPTGKTIKKNAITLGLEIINDIDLMAEAKKDFKMIFKGLGIELGDYLNKLSPSHPELVQYIRNIIV